MAVGSAPAAQVERDRGAEREEQRERRQRSPKGRAVGHEGRCGGELGQRQERAEQARDSAGHPEVGEGALRPGAVRELREACRREHRSEADPRPKQDQRHGSAIVRLTRTEVNAPGMESEAGVRSCIDAQRRA